ncbi:MAG: ribonuclease H, partial [Eudoraea sp.]|nr:ribonuclease H [Eudoraea sp.]
MAKKQKYYVVWQGKRPGIYTSWDECNAQIKGVQGARYKAFTSRDEAEEAFN